MYAMNFAQVGANIQRQLDMKGLTQQQLAYALGISKQVMNKTVKGSKVVNVNELDMIASVLGTSSGELLSVPVELSASNGILSFIRRIKDEKTLDKVNIIHSAIDEIHLLEEFLHA